MVCNNLRNALRPIDPTPSHICTRVIAVKQNLKMGGEIYVAT